MTYRVPLKQRSCPVPRFAACFVDRHLKQAITFMVVRITPSTSAIWRFYPDAPHMDMRLRRGCWPVGVDSGFAVRLDSRSGLFATFILALAWFQASRRDRGLL